MDTLAPTPRPGRRQTVPADLSPGRVGLPGGADTRRYPVALVVHEKPSEPRLRQSPVLPAVVAATLVLLLGGLVLSVVGHRWFPTSDQAIEILRIREVGTSHTPLIGAYSRLGFAHPGPLLFWTLAPFERLFGDTGVLVGCAVVNVASLGVAVWVAHRHGGARLAVLLWLGEIGLVNGLGLGLLLDPWNPWLPVLPFLAFLLLLWAVALGDLALIPLAVLFGSFSVQSHVGYAPLVVGLAVAAAVACVLGRRRRDPGDADRAPPRSAHRATAPQAGRRWAWAGLVLFVLLWLAPLLQQVFDRRGNLAALTDALRDPGQAATGWVKALGVAGTELGPVPAWLRGNDTRGFGLVVSSRVWPAILVLLLGIGLAVLTAKRYPAPLGRAIATLMAGTAVGSVLAVVATARVSGALLPYLVRWWWPLAMLTYVAVAWGLVELAVPVVAPVLQRWIGRGALAAGAVATVAVGVVGLPAGLPLAPSSTAVAHLVGPTARSLDHHQRYFMVSIESLSLGATGVGMFAALEERGYRVYVDPMFRQAISDRRVLDERNADATLLVVAGEDEAAGWTPPAGARLVASYEPLPATTRREERALQARFRALLDDQAPSGPLVVTLPAAAQLERRGVDPTDVLRLAEIQRLPDSYRIYLVPHTGRR